MTIYGAFYGLKKMSRKNKVFGIAKGTKFSKSPIRENFIDLILSLFYF